jgi:methylamine utilization protein MauE
MIQLIAALQPLLIGVVLIWSARIKLFSRQAASNASHSALVPLIGEQRALPAYRLLGGVELAVGILLVLPPALAFEAAAATALAVGFTGYLYYARTRTPDASCGCMNTRRTPVTRRSFVRAGFLALAGLIATLVTADWLHSLATHPVAGTGLLAAEVATVIALSPEFDDRWLLPLRRLRARLTHPLVGGTGVPLLSTVMQLQQSAAYRRVAAMLSSDVREHWDDNEWRFVCQSARYQGRLVTAVFAVPLLRCEPHAVRVAIVDEVTGATLLALDSTVDSSQAPDPPAMQPQLASR